MCRRPTIRAATLTKRRGTWATCAAVALVVALTHAYAAQPPSHVTPPSVPTASAPSTPAESFAMLPGEAELAVVFENAAEFRRTGLVDSAITLLDPEGLLGPIRKAWPELAAQLGWTSDEAFDALLGTRVMLTIVSEDARLSGKTQTKSGKNGGGRGETWALLSRVTPDAERRLKTQLSAAPRSLVEGHQILALPGGKFFYTLHHVRGEAARNEGGAWVVIGPSERAWLMYSVVARLRAIDTGAAPPTPPLSETARAAIERFAQLDAGRPAAPVQILLRLDQPGAEGRGSNWTDFLALTARSEPVRGADKAVEEGSGVSRWRLDVLLREEARAKELAAMPRFSDAPLRAMVAYSPLAAVLQGTSAHGDLGVSDHAHSEPINRAEATVSAILESFGLGGPDAPMTYGRQALLIETARPSVRADVQAVTNEQPASAAAITLAIELRAAAGGVASKTSKAARRPSTPREIAAAMDARVAQFVNTLEQHLAFPPAASTTSPPSSAAPLSPPARDFGGVFPEAPRVLPVAFAPDHPVAQFFDGELVLCWSFPGEHTAADDPMMWWAITAAPGSLNDRATVPPDAPEQPDALSRTPAEFHRRATRALTIDGPGGGSAASDLLAASAAGGVEGEAARWLSMGFVRPSALQSLLPGILQTTINGSDLHTALTHIPLLEWRIRATDEGDVAAELGFVVDQSPHDTESVPAE